MSQLGREEIFVFAVCGSKEHTDTLAFSLKKLKKFTSKQIIIVTDLTRNEEIIDFENVLHVETPTHFNNHQASIFLKTGLPQFLPKGNLYCYLDTDVVAMNDSCDLIFKEYKQPIRFAPDHCKMPLFSPSAVECNCSKEMELINKPLNLALDEEDPFRKSTDEKIVQRRKELEEAYWQNKISYWSMLKIAIRYFFARRIFKLNEELSFNKKTRIWSDSSGLAFMKTPDMKKVTKKLGLKWSWLDPVPRLKDGRSVWRLECNHLQEQILQKFNVNVKKANWQHWNGGVFLFDDTSYDFLKNWHDYTMLIFEDNNWKTRDQGTLIATVWKFGLENHPTLDKKWNLLADYYNPEVKWEDDGIRMSKTEVVKPAFTHVYHHFFDKNWLLWRKIEEL